MKDMTERNLQEAFAGESQAHLKYAVYAELAERERLGNVARLFRAVSFSEQMHAVNHLHALKGAGKTLQNLEAALAGEIFEIDEMYPIYAEVATLQEEERAQRSMEDALAAEKEHARLYMEAFEAVVEGNDVTLDKLWVCDVCGFTLEGSDAPERCPVCGAMHARFREF